ncbi:hypothetical protein AXF42_Ash015605 [Apostasia shenzhenica]|uniref:Uncharacterized protein n=1 Tax=Apostasia shenzhenica TaxID=1088818 RepID=A0A2I0AKP6_9ASPA|nr:hypothetical protein AXF42_Ash015605 [Apostasia shenzhenica]
MVERKPSAKEWRSSAEETICEGTRIALRRRGDNLRRRWRGNLQRRHRKSFEVETTRSAKAPATLCSGEETFGDGMTKLHEGDDLTWEALRWRGKFRRRNE